jgi:hypothetical protein
MGSSNPGSDARLLLAWLTASLDGVGTGDMPVWQKLELLTRDDIGAVMVALADDRRQVLADRRPTSAMAIR